MKSFQNIFLLLVTFSVLMTPMMSFTVSLPVEKKEIKMKCCTTPIENDRKDKGCCRENNKESKKGCGDKCPISDCNLQLTKNIQLFFNSNQQEIVWNNSVPENIQTEKSSFLIIKELSYSFWHPPKDIS